jgi:nicotinamide mononucleotide adenylyltransferase
MLDECDNVIIAVGSAQESGTERNPFNFYQRADLITNVFYQHIIAGRMSIIPLTDREKPSNDASWGDYVFDIVKSLTTKAPDVIYEGEEDERSTWYDNLDVEIVRVPRNKIRVSATELREALADDSDNLSFRAYAMLPAAITYRITDMRKVIKDAKQN